MNHAVAVIAAPLFLAAGQQGSVVPPVSMPLVVVPTVTMPPTVQRACEVLTWAAPAASTLIGTSDTVQNYIAAAGPAIAACAAGNAGAAIVDLAAALEGILASRGLKVP